MPVGRKPLPTHLKVLRGKPGHRALPENEAQPEVLDAMPRPPAYLDGGAVEAWEELYPMLERNRLITEADVLAFTALCQAYGRWREAEKMIATQGMVVLTPTGFPVQHPYLAISNKAFEQMGKLMVEFGMTPSSRSRVQVSGSPIGKKSPGSAGGGNKFLSLASGSTSKAKRSA